MCIIAISEIGHALPDAETRRIMWENNPDGAGFMYARNGKVHIRKGFMTYDEFEDAIANLDFDPADVQFMMHFRIGTHGGNTPQNTHPFPVTRRVKPMQELKYDCDLAFMHNGIINSVKMIKKSISDTMEYGRQILADLYSLDNKFYKRPSLQMLIEESINNSRMVFLNGKGEIVKLGTWVEGEDGNTYSNTTYKDWRKKVYDYSKWDDERWNNWKTGGTRYTTEGYDYAEDKKYIGNSCEYEDEIVELYEIPEDCYISFNGELEEPIDEYKCDVEGNVFCYEYEYDAYFWDPSLEVITQNMQSWKPNINSKHSPEAVMY